MRGGPHNLDEVEGGRAKMSIQMQFGILKDPVSWATHFAGFLAAIVGLVFLIVFSSESTAKVASMAIYGSSLVILFGASSTYHFMDLGKRGNTWLQRLDHCAIFLLIAGSYIPAVVHLLDGPWRIAILSVVCGLAVAGVIFKIVWIECPDWLGTLLYVGLGWLAVIPAHRMLPELTGGPIALLVLGGLAYTLGAVVFVKEWPDPWPKVFGHHEIWHLFVLAGAACHFFFMWSLLDHEVPAF